MNLLALKTAFRDLGKNRTRAILGIFGITISISLLSVVSLLMDSVSVAFVDFITTDSGNRDIDITVNQVPDQPGRSSFFEFQAMVNQIKALHTEFEKFIPRIETKATTLRYEKNEWVSYSIPIVAMNASLEDQLNFGSFDGTSYDFSNGIPGNQCVITPAYQEFFHVGTGDNVTLTRSGTTINVTVLTVADSTLKFIGVASGGESQQYAIALSFETFEYWQGSSYSGKINHLLLTFSNPADYYDVRNLELSVQRALAVAESLQETVGWGYKVSLPKLTYLQYSEYLTAMLSVIFIFISIISMLIAGILIHGILTTSVEERIREFGIFRTLGARKGFNIRLILYQGFLLCLGGTTAGFLGAVVVTKWLVIPGIQYFAADYISSEIPFIVSPTAIALSYGIGISVSLVVSLAPAIKVARLEIVQAINPYRHEETLYKIMKESKVNYKLILLGSLLAINGAFIFFLIPQLLFSLNITLLSGMLVVVITVFLIGFTFIGLGLMPLLQRFFIAFFTPFVKKIINIIRITLYRYQRRNTTTVLMFSVSFAFIIFTTSIVTDIEANVSTMQRFNSGSQLVINSDEAHGTIPTVDFQFNLTQIQGIEKTSIVVAQPSTLNTIYSSSQKTFSVDVADYINFQSQECTIYPVDEYYPDTVFAEYIEFTQGDMATAFPQLFLTDTQNCIISTAVAGALSVQLGDQVRLTFTRGEESTPVAFTVVGIASKMPGLARFKSSQLIGGSNGGVMISPENYLKYMDICSPAWVEKIFVKVQENSYAQLGAIQEYIQDTYGTQYSISVSNVEVSIAEQTSTFSTISLLFETVLTATIVICLFGLLSATYSTILERRREIAVLRTLGLKSFGVSTLFSLESLITFLSSSISGTIIGYITAYLLSGTMNLFTESPNAIGFPLMTFMRIFAISIAFLLGGLWVLLRRFKKQNIIEIYRETL